MLKRALIALLLVIVAAGAVVVVRIGPANLIGMLRYDQRDEGTLRSEVEAWLKGRFG